MNTELSRSDAINWLIQQQYVDPYYLEIGVWCGATFKYINSKNKDGVDPGQYCDSEYVNYKMTSDIFFSDYINKKYDIIFIDGLHTAYQVNKDIQNALKFINKGGWIVLDDIYPHNENEQNRLDLRKEGAQTGDVWKTVYHFMKELESISEQILFLPNTERGLLMFKILNNDYILPIEPSIPVCNIDGYYIGNDAEWNKYTYAKDFNNYLLILQKYKINLHK